MKWVPLLILSFCGVSNAVVISSKTYNYIWNPFTGTNQYVTSIDTNSIQGAGVSISSTPEGVLITGGASAPCGNSGDVQINLNGACGGIGGGITGFGSEGIQSIGVNNGVLTSVTGANNSVIYSSNSVSYLGISSATSGSGISASSVAVSYIAISSIANQVQTSSLNVTGGNIYVNGSQIGMAISTYAPTGVFNFTTTTNTIAIGTSSMTVTLISSGTYRISGQVNLRYAAATFAANQFVTLNFYRQNNTPGVLLNSQTSEETSVITSITSQFGQFNLPDVFYTTTNTNDVLSIHGSITATPGAGNFQATEACLIAELKH